MKSDFHIERFEIELIEIEIDILKKKAIEAGKNSPKIEHILQQIDEQMSRVDRLQLLEIDVEKEIQFAQDAEIKRVKNKFLQLLHELESEVADDKLTKYLHKAIAKIKKLGSKK